MVDEATNVLRPWFMLTVPGGGCADGVVGTDGDDCNDAAATGTAVALIPVMVYLQLGTKNWKNHS